MSLIEIKTEPGLFRHLISVLNRIADALDRAYPQSNPYRQGKPYGPEDLITFDPEKEAAIEAEESRREENGEISSR